MQRLRVTAIVLAVSAMAITAMTPACTGSDTTRSAMSGTLPAMFSEITINPLDRTSSTAAAMSPPISEPASTSRRTRGSRTTARTAAARPAQPAPTTASFIVR